jgi:polysaccharide export outer membrane protein
MDGPYVPHWKRTVGVRRLWASRRLLIRQRLQLVFSIALGLLALAPVPVPAQMPAVTPEQIEIFRSLPPEQQQAILESATGVGTADEATSEPGDTTRRTPASRGAAGTTRGGKGKDGAGARFLGLGGLEREEVRIKAGDTVVIKARLREDSTRSQGRDAYLRRLLQNIVEGNPYKLDADGLLTLRGVAPILLAGLTEEEATARVLADPALLEFQSEILLLPVVPIGEDGLELFGYQWFRSDETTLTPLAELPVPGDYVVGPGDRIEVQLLGNTTSRHSLVVNRDGRIMFPALGPVAVAGLRFDEARARIEARVAEEMINTRAAVTMGELRSIRVLVLGEVVQPGARAVSGQSTITNALMASGGVTDIGSLRNVQLKRGGRLVRTLDLYDLLIEGDSSADVRLQAGDVVLVPPVGPTAGITGQVRRPAIYELRGQATLGQLLDLAGGLKPVAARALATLHRFDAGGRRTVQDVDLGEPEVLRIPLRAGDLLDVPGGGPTVQNAVRLEGHVYRTRTVQYRPGLRLTDLIRSVHDLKPNADLGYVLVRREEPGTRRVSVVSADVGRALANPAGSDNIALHPLDRVIVFDLVAGRQQLLSPIVDELRLQGTAERPSAIVRVDGPVRVPGEYPLEPQMTVSELLRAAGGLAEDAYGGEAELARYEVRDGATRQTAVHAIDLGRALAKDPAADLPLAPFDFLVVKRVSQWQDQATIALEGQVKFPGVYPITEGETLRDVIERAGGLTPLAFPEGAVFTRESLRQREAQQIETLAERLRQDLAALALQGAQVSGATGDPQASAELLAVGRSLLDELTRAKPVGRLVIDWQSLAASNAGKHYDLLLKDGDRLVIPKRAQEVTVIGEVQNATSHLYVPGLSRDDYLEMSGGTRKRADTKRIYVVRANGKVEVRTSAWFAHAAEIKPGDTIVVPLDTERMRPLPMWSAITTILYNIAVAVAAVNSF